MKRRIVWMVILFFSVYLIFLSIVTAQQIGSINVKTQKGGGAVATFTIFNSGETGAYHIYAKCEGNPFGNNVEGSIQSGESKTISVDLSEEGCNKLNSCTIFVESVGGNIQKNVTFVNDCSLCGTGSETCQANTTICSGNQIKQCDNYCRTANVIETCPNGCSINDGKASCEKQFDWIPIIYYGIILLLIILVVLVILKLKKK